MNKCKSCAEASDPLQLKYLIDCSAAMGGEGEEIWRSTVNRLNRGASRGKRAGTGSLGEGVSHIHRRGGKRFGRPAADVQADDYRKPAKFILFARVKPGDNVLELLGMGGYYTRLLSKVVGNTGHVYTTVPPALQTNPMFAAAAKAISSNSSYSNVTVLVQPPGTPAAPVPVDVVWLTDNYHDLHNPGPLSAGDIDAFNKSVFKALKPGGMFFVIDHATAPGMGLTPNRHPASDRP